MEIYETEAPGGQMAWQCPYCSCLYPQVNEKDEPNEPPTKCRRCGSPMDIKAFLKYADTQAELAAHPTELVGRQVVKV